MSSDPKASQAQMEKIVSLCKRRGFIYQSSEIYGGCGGVWDYGPLGAELKRNLRTAWWNTMTREREDVLGLDASILMNPAIWKASGHVDTFADLMRECSLTNKRVRADHVDPQDGVVMKYSGAKAPNGWRWDRAISALLKNGEHIESFRKRIRALIAQNAGEAAGKPEEIELLGEEKIDAVNGSVDFHPETGGMLGEARPFNLMLKTYLGPTATEDDVTYLRPETAQAIFAQFKNVFDSSRVKVPFGIGQIGKAFRNEVTPKNFTFRSREFEQMELEFFIKPDEAVEIISGEVAKWHEGADLSEPQPNWGWELWHRYWVDQRTKFYQGIGLGDVLEYYWQTPADLAHYARACVDILCEFPFGTEELEGIAARGDFDLSAHQTASTKSQMELEFFIKPDEAVEIISGEVAKWHEGADLREPQPNWGWELWHRYWVDQRTKFYQGIGLGDVLEYYWQTPADLAHYARACVDILCEFPFGTEELEGIAARGDFDLSAHQTASTKSQEIFDEELKTAAAKLTDEQKEALIQKRLAAEAAKTKGEPMPEAAVRAWFERLFKGNYVPHVIEPSAGLDRMALAVIAKAFSETEKVDEKGKKEVITVLRLHPRVAPIKVGVFPLLKNKPELVAKAREVYALLKKHMNCFYDETASIGRRYARQDEVGTPFGVTIDFETCGEKGPELQDTVTLRHRDSGEQERVKISELLGKLLPLVS